MALDESQLERADEQLGYPGLTLKIGLGLGFVLGTVALVLILRSQRGSE